MVIFLTRALVHPFSVLNGTCFILKYRTPVIPGDTCVSFLLCSNVCRVSEFRQKLCNGLLLYCCLKFNGKQLSFSFSIQKVFQTLCEIISLNLYIYTCTFIIQL